MDKIYDLGNIVSKLTFNKILNVVKVLISFYKSKKSKTPYLLGYPISISVEPTTSCNLRCPQCPSGLRSFTRPTGMLDLVLFQKIIEETKNHLVYLTLYFQGEPYLNPNFLEMVSFASKNKIYTATSTNGHYLDPKMAKQTVKSGLDRLIISIDGTTQKSYQNYRVGGKLEKVKEGIDNLVQSKKELKSRTPYLILQFIVFNHNENEIEEIKLWAKNWEIDLQLKTAQIYDYEQGVALIPTNEKYARYKTQENNEIRIDNALDDQCWRMWQSCVITWDGKVVPCCFDKDAKYQFGNLEVNDFTQVWQSPEYQQFRTKLLTSRKEIDICSNCSEGSKVFV
jgi:radical SAM protein with 4Fe4S-binding SPASM domain